MTTIAFRDGWLAADTLTTDGNERLGYGVKIGVATDAAGATYGYGASGVSGLCARFKAWAATGCDGEPPSLSAADGKEVAYGYLFFGDRVRHFEPGVPPFELRMHQAEDGTFFASFGSGSSYALGAMALGANAAKAVRVAMGFDIATGGDVSIESLLLAPPREDAAASKGPGVTHIERVEINVSTNQDPSRIARAIVDEMKDISRNS